MDKSPRRRLTGRRVLMMVIPAAVIVTAGVIFRFLITFDTDRMLLSPRFSQTGDSILFAERVARGVTAGPGIEFLTPPAYLHVLSDRFALKEMNLDGRVVRTHMTWSIPRKQYWIPVYRNHLFGIPKVEIETRDACVRVQCTVGETEYPTTVYHSRTLYCDLRTGQPVDQSAYDRKPENRPWHEHILNGQWEVLSYRHRTILLERFDNGLSLERIVLKDADREPMTEEQLLADLEFLRRRPSLEKLDQIRKKRAELIEKYRDHGLPDYQAELNASDDLEEMGFYPRTPRLVAERTAAPPEGTAVFPISDMEFRVGLFQDIDAAISSPGKKIRFWGNYVRHRDFTTSERLNAWLDENDSFVADTSRGFFLVKVLYRRGTPP